MRIGNIGLDMQRPLKIGVSVSNYHRHAAAWPQRWPLYWLNRVASEMFEAEPAQQHNESRQCFLQSKTHADANARTGAKR